MKQIQTFLICFIFSHTCTAQEIEKKVQHYIDSIYQAHPSSVGIMVHVESPEKKISWNYAVGVSDKVNNTPLSAQQPFLTASNTKTYVAAAILKLVEMKKFILDQSIDSLLPVQTNQLFKNDGYKTNEITVRHLLSHTSGIADYVNDDYFEFVNKNKKYKWTRNEQITLATKVGTPLSAPSDTFQYADINYVLLTEIIEKYTHEPFYKAIKKLLGYKGNKIKNTWFVDLENKPKNVLPMVHQYWNKYPWDSYDLDPSWDLYGGGGIATTPKDMAVFFQLLFDGNIIKDKNLLSQLYTPVPCKTKTNYCLGIRKLYLAGHAAYYHGGFWGTDAMYFPDFKTSISIVILEKKERDLSAEISKAIVEILSKTN
ncbi:MAG: beta-lactamase family protein [Bacteroidetes bacterium]|nr:beta-lactamase family protein [Bacteroidota bacterium]